MKKITLLTLAVGALALAGCSANPDGAGTGSQKSAIESVLAQRTKLKAEGGPSGLLTKQGLSGLMAIDVQACPDDFRSAWFDYLVQVQNLCTRGERVAMFAEAAGKPVKGVPGLVKFAVTNPKLGEYLLGAVDGVDQSWEKLARTALNYGVMPER